LRRAVLPHPRRSRDVSRTCTRDEVNRSSVPSIPSISLSLLSCIARKILFLASLASSWFTAGAQALVPHANNGTSNATKQNPIVSSACDWAFFVEATKFALLSSSSEIKQSNFMARLKVRPVARERPILSTMWYLRLRLPHAQ